MILWKWDIHGLFFAHKKVVATRQVGDTKRPSMFLLVLCTLICFNNLVVIKNTWVSAKLIDFVWISRVSSSHIFTNPTIHIHKSQTITRLYRWVLVCRSVREYFSCEDKQIYLVLLLLWVMSGDSVQIWNFLYYFFSLKKY
jgi:hypothetical protein